MQWLHFPCLIIAVLLSSLPLNAQRQDLAQLPSAEAPRERMHRLGREMRGNTTPERCLAYAKACCDVGSIQARQAAVEALKTALAQDPDLTEARLLLASLYERYARESARKQYHIALERDSSSVEAWTRLAHIYAEDYHEWSHSVRRSMIPHLEYYGEMTARMRRRYSVSGARGLPNLVQKMTEGGTTSNAPLDEAAMEDFEQAVLCFEHALRLDTHNIELRLELALLLFGANRDEAALDVLRDARDGERYQYDHLLLRGVLLHRLNRDAEARKEFERAFPLMTARERDYFLRGSSMDLLKPKMGKQFSSSSASELADGIARFWDTADPLYLTEENEALMEHYTRVAIAALRYRVPSLGLKGWDTDRGRTLLHMGEPLQHIRIRPEIELGESTNNWQIPASRVTPKTDLWLYEDVVLGFADVYSNGNFRFNDPVDQGHAWLDAESAMDFDYISRIKGYRYTPRFRGPLISAPCHIARFLSLDADERRDVDMVVTYALPKPPVGEAAHTLGVFLLDEEGKRVVDIRRNIDVAESRQLPSQSTRQGGGVVNAVTFFPPTWSGFVSVEMLREADEGVSITRMPLRIAPPRAGLDVSDLLLAESISDGPSPAHPLTRGNVHLAPWPDAAFHHAAQPWLYVEIYNLALDETAATDFDVSLTVEQSGSSSSFFESVTSFLGLGSDERRIVSTTSYTTDSRDVQLPLRIDVRNVPAGKYTLSVEVKDNISGEKLQRTREITIFGE